ncbi:TRAP transporter large permease [Algihabitans albus]|uniref:TRAP transporter large permease n=1 Tax=Algihabitans albus TaxID=2164067 RepID=UPI000E5CE9B6|nr:TRAP transporter large permease [Algihabitans albus]
MTWFAGLLILFGLSVPIAVGLIAIGLGFLTFDGRIDQLIAAQRVATGIDNFALTAIPFFLLAAELMNRTGITDRIFHLANCLLGRVPGGLGYVNVGASMLFASMSGSAVADAVGLGRIEIRAMTQAGYDRDFSAAVTAASTTIAPILPPSISLIIFGVTSGASIGGLFLGGILPGLLMGLALMVVIYLHVRRRNYPPGPKIPGREILCAAAGAFWPLMMPVIIVGGIWTGIFTPTEAGACAVLYALALGLAYGTLKWGDIVSTLFESALASANILFIIAASALIAWLLTMGQVPLHFAAVILDLSPNPYVFLLFLNLLLLVLGCFMAAAPVIIMVTPIILPAAVAMGLDPIHLGVVMVLNLMIGLITPPVGLCLFAVAEVASISPLRLIRALLPFFVPLLASLLLITLFPGLVLFVPRLFGFAN